MQLWLPGLQLYPCLASAKAEEAIIINAVLASVIEFTPL